MGAEGKCLRNLLYDCRFASRDRRRDRSRRSDRNSDGGVSRVFRPAEAGGADSPRGRADGRHPIRALRRFRVGRNRAADHELEARVKAILRRSKRNREDAEGNEEDIIRVGDLVIDRGTYTVTKSGLELSLSRKEFELLYLLASNRGRVLTRETLLERVWGYDYVGETRTVDVHAWRTRRTSAPE